MAVSRDTRESRGGDSLNPLPFRSQCGRHGERNVANTGRASESSTDDLPETADDLLDAFDTMSRRIDDLARELNCLGYFDDDDDRPRAA